MIVILGEEEAKNKVSQEQVAQVPYGRTCMKSKKWGTGFFFHLPRICRNLVMSSNKLFSVLCVAAEGGGGAVVLGSIGNLVRFGGWPK